MKPGVKMSAQKSRDMELGSNFSVLGLGLAALEDWRSWFGDRTVRDLLCITSHVFSFKYLFPSLESCEVSISYTT